MVKLNGWQRIGLVVSALWALFIVVLSFEFFARHGLFDPFDPLLLDHVSSFLGAPPRFLVLLVALIVPIAGGWLFFYAVVKIIKWIMAGFNVNKGI